MKLTFSYVSFLVATMTNFSHAMIKDIGVIGPNANVILYYRDANFIIAKFCKQNTVLEPNVDQSSDRCEGKFYRIPVESFQRSLRDLVTSKRSNLLKPIDPKEVESYNKDAQRNDQIEAMYTELESINQFIRAYGEENANLSRKKELIIALNAEELRLQAIKKVNSEIETTMDLISNKYDLTILKSNTNGDQFSYTVLKDFNPDQKFPCGLNGSINERIKDCSYQTTSSKEGFILVTKSKENFEVYKEISTGLLWSDKSLSSIEHYRAYFVGNVCDQSSKSFAGLTGLNWRLPTSTEYKKAEKNGIRKVLPNMNEIFWASDVKVFNGKIGQVFEYDTTEFMLLPTYSFRCVTEL